MSMRDMDSDNDFLQVTQLLDSDDLYELYQALGMNYRDIRNAEIDAPSNAVDIQAMHVLAEWKRQNGFDATRRALLNGLDRCGNIEAKERLEDIWNGREWNAKPEADFYKIIKPLGSEELLRLYHVLGLAARDIERAESRVKSHDSHQKAQSVMRWWKKQNWRKATCEILQEAVKSCRTGTTTAKPIATKEASDFDVQLIREQLMEEYRETRGKLPLLPGVPEEFADMEDLFVDLEIDREVKKPSDVIYKELKSYGDLVCIERKTKSGHDKDFVKRILVKGKPGIGKSTIVSKLAYDWACNKQDSPMSRFKLVFVITINEIDADTDLIGVIQDQLLPEVSRQGLKDYLQSHASSVAILLDGYDEATSHFDRYKDITNVLRSKWLAAACIIVTTRSNHVGNFSQKYGPYLLVQINGFSPYARERYVKKFFHLKAEVQDNTYDDYDGDNDVNQGDYEEEEKEEEEKKKKKEEEEDDEEKEEEETGGSGYGNINEVAQTLLLRIDISKSLHELSVIPIILSMLCLLWGTDADLPTSVTALYKDVLLHLARHKYDKIFRNDLDAIDRQSREWVNDVLLHVGEKALKGLFEDKLVFTSDEFEEKNIGEACRLGVLITERKRSRTNITRRITFLHKTFQEMCAASYLASVVDMDLEIFNKYLGYITKDNVFGMEIFLRFTCGLSVKAAKCMLQHVVRIMYTEYQHLRLRNVRPLIDMTNFFANLYQRLPLFLLYESEVNAQSEDCCSLHASMKPLYNYIRIGDICYGYESTEFLEIFKHYINAKRCTWLDDVFLADVNVSLVSDEDFGLLSDFICAMTKLHALQIENSISNYGSQKDLSRFIELLLRPQSPSASLSELYLHGVSCAARQFCMFLSSLKCLTNLEMIDVLLKGELSCPVSLPKLKDLSIVMEKGPQETLEITKTPIPGRSGAMTVRIGSVRIQHSFSTPVVLDNLLSSLPLLEKLTLENIPLERQISAHLPFPSLKDFNISGSHEILMLILDGFSRAKDFSQDLSQSKPTKSLVCLPLESVSIRNIRFDEARKLSEVMQYMPYLRRLALPSTPSFSNIKPDDWVKIFDWMAEALEKMTKYISDINAESGRGVESGAVYATHIEEIDFSHNRLDHSIRSFVRAYRFMPHLKYLNLSSTCKFHFEGFHEPSFFCSLIDAFIEAGRKQTPPGVGLPLEYLHLSGNNRGNLAFQLARVLPYMTSLKEFACSTFDPSEFAVLFDGFILAGENCKFGLSLRILNLSYVGLSGGDLGDSVGKLAQALLYLTDLKELNLTSSDLKPPQCAVLFDGFIAAGKRLQELPVTGTESDTEARCLKLEVLMLRGNEIGESVDKFCEALRYMSCLKKLNCGLKEKQKVMVRAVLKDTIPDYSYNNIYWNL